MCICILGFNNSSFFNLAVYFINNLFSYNTNFKSYNEKMDKSQVIKLSDLQPLDEGDYIHEFHLCHILLQSLCSF